MKKDLNKLMRLECRVMELEEQVGNLLFFLNDAIKMRRDLDLGVDQQEIDRLLP